MKTLLLSLLIVLFAIPALAFTVPVPVEGMKLEIYGSARMVGYYRFADGHKVTPAKSDFIYELQSNSRFGIRFSYEGFFANIETNYAGDGDGGIGFRQFYGGYNFSNGLTITAGQKTTLTGFSGTIGDMYFTNNGLNGFGAIGDRRRPLVMLSYAGLDIAIVDPTRNSAIQGLSVNTNIPRIEVAYNLKFTNLKGKIFGSYQYNEYKNIANYKTGMNGFAIGAHAIPTFGSMFINVGAFYAMNAGVYGSVRYMGFGTTGPTALLPKYNIAKNKIEDVHSIGAALEFGMKFTNKISSSIGGGYQINMSDSYKDSDGSTYNKCAYGVFVNMTYKMNKYITLKPQIGYYNSYEGSTSAGMLLAGTQLRFDF